MDFNKWTKEELQKKLKGLNLPTGGDKAALVERLQTGMASVGPGKECIEADIKSKSDSGKDDNCTDEAIGNSDGAIGNSASSSNTNSSEENSRVIRIMKELELLKREKDLLVKENELLRREKQLSEKELILMQSKTEDRYRYRNSENNKNKGDGSFDESVVNMLNPDAHPFVSEYQSANILNDNCKEEDTNKVLVEKGDRLSVSQLRELIYDFDGRTPLQPWMAQVMAVKTEYRVPDSMMKLVIIGKLTNTALNWFYSKPEFVQLPLNELLVQLTKMFQDPVDRIELRKQFENRIWKNSESFSQYYHDKVILANRLSLPEADVLDYVISGLNNKILQNQARMQCFKTLEELFAALSKLSPADRYHNAKSDSTMSTRVYNGKVAATQQDDIHCYNCKAKGHRGENCKRSNRNQKRCFKCDGEGHFIKDCPNVSKHGKPASEVHLINPVYSVAVRSSNLTITGILDSGSPISLIKDKYVSKDLVKIDSDITFEFCGINSSRLTVIGIVEFNNIFVNNLNCRLKFRVVPDSTMTHDCILGRDFIGLNNATVTLKGDSLKLEIPTEVEKCAERFEGELLNIDIDLDDRVPLNFGEVSDEDRLDSLNVNTLENSLIFSQTQDKEIGRIKKLLESQESPFYELRNGVVYRKLNGNILFYVPDSMVSNVIRNYHDTVGHVGIDKTRELIIRNYWFPNMKSRIKEYIMNCLTCISFQPKETKRCCKLQNIDKGTFPFELVHVDHYGPISLTKRKNRFVFLIVDGFTKFVKIYACKTTNSKEVIKHLTDYFNNYSRPKILISDRGSCFRSNDFLNFIVKENIKHVLVATACPKANGQVERMNRFLTPVLSKIAFDKNCDWDRILTDVEYVFNNTWNRSIDTTPCKMLFGRNQRNIACDNLAEILEGNNLSKVCLQEIRDQAISKNLQVQDYNKQQYDSKCKTELKFNVGDYVVIRNTIAPGEDKKLSPKFKGPYLVKKVLPHNRYLLTDIDGFQITQLPFEGMFESSNMKPWLNDKGNNNNEIVNGQIDKERAQRSEYSLRPRQDGRAVVDQNKNVRV